MGGSCYGVVSACKKPIQKEKSKRTSYFAIILLLQ